MVEDTDVMKQLILAILENLNHEVTIADNGKDAIDCVKGEDFDIILMDVRMPVMDGLEATALIRSMDGEKSNIPIIALTADLSAGNIKEYLGVGMNEVCVKPLDLPMLFKAMNTLLGEEIHTSVPQAPSATQDRQATDIEDSSELAAKDASFAHVLERVSNNVDHLTEPNKDRVPSLKMAGVDAEKLAKLLAEYEEGLIEKCDKLKTAIDDLAKIPADDDLRSEVSMMVHSMIGGGGTFGYDLITTIATEAEALLQAKDTLEAEDIRTLGNHVEALSLIANKRLSGHGGKAGRILLRGLKDFS